MRSCRPVRRRWCAICGSTKDIEQHHLGGRNHFPYVTIPLCRWHHVRITIAIQHAGIDMSYTSDRPERVRRALQACLVFQWYVCQESQVLPERLVLLVRICSTFQRLVCPQLEPKLEGSYKKPRGKQARRCVVCRAWYEPRRPGILA